MRKLPSASEMEHITSKEFGENMDAILDRVLKEDIALVIDHENKSYVLCPSRWFEPLESTQMQEDEAADKTSLIQRLNDPQSVILNRLCDEIFADG